MDFYSVAHGGGVGARHGWGVSKGLGQMVGYVGGALASSVGGALVGVGSGAANHLLHGTPTGPEEEDESVQIPPPRQRSSAAASSSTSRGIPSEPQPVYLLDRPIGEAVPANLQDRPMPEHRSMLRKEQQRYKDIGESTGEDPFYPWRPYRKHRTP